MKSLVNTLFDANRKRDNQFFAALYIGMYIHYKASLKTYWGLIGIEIDPNSTIPPAMFKQEIEKVQLEINGPDERGVFELQEKGSISPQKRGILSVLDFTRTPVKKYHFVGKVYQCLFFITAEWLTAKGTKFFAKVVQGAPSIISQVSVKSKIIVQTSR